MNTVQCLLVVTSTDPLLRWLCFILLSGAIFSAIMLRILSRGFLGPVTAQHPEGKPFSIFAFQFPFSHQGFKKFLEQLPYKALKPVQWSLKADYLFMAFVYPFLACSAWYLLRNCRPGGFLAGHETTVALLLRWGIGLSFTAWLLDVAENLLLLSCLRRLSFLKSRAVLLVSLLKWVCVLFVVGILGVVILTGYCA